MFVPLVWLLDPLPAPQAGLPPGAEPHSPDHSPEGLHEVEVGKLMAVHKGLEDLQVEGIPGEGRKEGTRTWELVGTHLPEGVEVGEGEEGSRVLLPDPAAFCSAHLCLSPGHPPHTLTGCSPGRRALASEQPALGQVLPLPLPAWMTLLKPLGFPRPNVPICKIERTMPTPISSLFPAQN